MAVRRGASTTDAGTRRGRDGQGTLPTRYDTIKNGPTLGRMGPFRKSPLEEPEGAGACRFSICQSDGYRDIASTRQMIETGNEAPRCVAGRQSSQIGLLP
ncbi:hypothetical protein D3C85_1517140 [compost metagenome]